jgi:hypothetical protein
MSNDTFLIVSYFGVAALCAGIGVATFVYLRREFGMAAKEAVGDRFARVLEVLFPPGIILPALAGFLAIEYQSGCHSKSYQQIVSDKGFLISINKLQVSSAFAYVVYALGAWLVIILLGALRQRSRSSVVGPHPPKQPQ